jgi:hypothetical protein
MAGMVTPTPKAMDSPAEPAVCTMLFSRMFASRRPLLAQRKKRINEMIATGMNVLKVIPYI